ncbi:uncharacterized protein FOMMEDRAFT_151419 [Fomitiporia mediterranea MF3/22]|uniref:uncharacterized protein n=1 Tax=Fomitiporia mediterranea (strain MF3/22) TaxID=694068 RepID=UPI00044095F6|nr:uncharacterized protein FOMMEDRAFT_151419 [Fomitiporia mediterranea MF3/22]EJD08551.1 hypothetical protein FOMMEDRAFT_151419 [Fomitiporia mediterranea MF3/22]
MNVLRASCFRQSALRYLRTASVSTTATPVASSSTSVHPPSNTQDALNHLRAQPSHYVIASLMGRRYLLAPRDLLTVPRLKSARVGDRLSLSQIHEVGSRDYTLRGDDNGTEALPQGVVNVEATVVEHTKGAMERIVKFKRRKHYQKTIEHKQPYTRLRIGPIRFGSPVEVEQRKEVESL